MVGAMQELGAFIKTVTNKGLSYCQNDINEKEVLFSNCSGFPSRFFTLGFLKSYPNNMCNKNE